VSVPRRAIGGVTVSAVGVGGARWSLTERPDDALVTRTVHAALDRGITLFDTARAYTPAGRTAHNERVLATALRRHPAGADAVVFTKGGHDRLPDGTFVVDGRPVTLRRHCEEALIALGVERLDAFLLHWPDPDVPLEESVGAIADLRSQGLVRLVGVCNVDLTQLRQAAAAVPLDLVQNPLSALAGGNWDVVDHCRRVGLAHLCYSPLGGSTGARALLSTTAETAEVCARHGASVHEVALAWLLAQGPALVPIVGAGRPESVASAARASTLELDTADLRVLDAVFSTTTSGGARDG
jgi:aryl-alcohol dehydrogenase-like predicted oxidoreductase